MSKSLDDNFSLLIKSISGMDWVVSIGKTGGKELPESNESDIDIFVYCTSTPPVEVRQMAIDRLRDIVTDSKFSTAEGRFWGTCDFVTLGGTEICLMYFSTEKADAEIKSILAGERLDREDNSFYPTGRCASILSMYILCDKTGFLAGMKTKLSVYPPELAEKVISRHIGQINDTEDFERAVSRADTLFYHFVLDNALDHFLQTLFALNKRFFPSRKRSIQFISGFTLKPADCEERVLQVIDLGGRPTTIPQSYRIWASLCVDLEALVSTGK